MPSLRHLSILDKSKSVHGSHYLYTFMGNALSTLQNLHSLQLTSDVDMTDVYCDTIPATLRELYLCSCMLRMRGIDRL